MAVEGSEGVSDFDAWVVRGACDLTRVEDQAAGWGRAADPPTKMTVEGSDGLRGFDVVVDGACGLTRVCDWTHGRGRLARAAARPEIKKEEEEEAVRSSAAIASQISDIAKEFLDK